MTYQPQPISTQGVKKEAAVTDLNSEELLRDILTEMKKMNLYLAVMADLYIQDKDLEQS